MKPANKDLLSDILKFHVVPGKLYKWGGVFYTVDDKQLMVEQLPHHTGLQGVRVAPYGGVFTAAGDSDWGDTKVTAADNEASNGVVHIIDGVLLPPAGEYAQCGGKEFKGLLTSCWPLECVKQNDYYSQCLKPTPIPPPTPTVDLVDLAKSVPELSTLVAALVAGDLATTLKGEGPFTLFAPTNDAFAALPEGTLDTLLKPENKAQLLDILTFHVLPSQVLSTDLDYNLQVVKTVEGQNMMLTVEDRAPVGQGFFVGASFYGAAGNHVQVTGADNLATNGVAHIISGVMFPPAAPKVDLMDMAKSLPELSTMVAAVVAGDLDTTLKGEGPFTLFAPYNDAWKVLDGKHPGTLDNLLKPENKKQLLDVLNFHVLPTQVLTTDPLLKPEDKKPENKWQLVDLKTVEGHTLVVRHTVEGFDSGLPIGITFVCPTEQYGEWNNCQNIRVRNHYEGAQGYLATNGVVHIIDGVMFPPAAEIQV